MFEFNEIVYLIIILKNPLSGVIKWKLYQKGFERKPYLEPQLRCSDDFELFADTHFVRLKILSTEKTFNDSEFCVVANDASIVVGEICRPISDLRKFK